MPYPEWFVKEVRELYPNSKGMEECIKNDSDLLGRYLDDSRYGIGISADDVLKATSLEELQNKVRLHKRKEALYGKWLEIRRSPNYVW